MCAAFRTILDTHQSTPNLNHIFAYLGPPYNQWTLFLKFLDPIISLRLSVVIKMLTVVNGKWDIWAELAMQSLISLAFPFLFPSLRLVSFTRPHIHEYLRIFIG